MLIFTEPSGEEMVHRKPMVDRGFNQFEKSLGQISPDGKKLKHLFD